MQIQAPNPRRAFASFLAAFPIGALRCIVGHVARDASAASIGDEWQPCRTVRAGLRRDMGAGRSGRSRLPAGNGPRAAEAPKRPDSPGLDGAIGTAAGHHGGARSIRTCFAAAMIRIRRRGVYVSDHPPGHSPMRRQARRLTRPAAGGVALRSVDRRNPPFASAGGAGCVQAT